MLEEDRKTIFASWLEQYKTLMYKVVRAYAFTGMDREDLFQEICLQMWNSVPAFRGEASVSTWLYRVSLNTAYKWSKRERRYTESADDSVGIFQPAESPLDERLEWLFTEIAKLNEADRSITLLLLDGVAYKEIASIVGITESNVGVRINRIKKYLTTRVQKNNEYGI